MIPRPFIDDLLQRVDIIELIERYTHLKKAGKNYVACCPFHSEKTPSFTVSQQKQFYHCFGCGAHGNVIGFLMSYDHLTFVEAIRELADKVGLKVPFSESFSQEKQKNQIHLALEKANQYYQQQLKDHSQLAQVHQYLQRRGLSKTTIEQFGLGFAPAGWDLLLHFFEKERISLQDAVTAGLLIEKDGGGYYDRFRDRLLFPIRNRKGVVIGFGGRVLDEEVKPKYLNSPETPLFHKGQTLYGLYEAMQSIRSANQLLVVEGYMDVIALSENGIPHVVATLGTGVTEQHIEQVMRLVPYVIFCFDGDSAGQEAAWRALLTSLPFLGNGKQVSFLILSEDDDPDSLVRRNGRDYFLKLTESAIPLSTFLFRKLSARVNMGSLEGKAQFLNEAKWYLTKMKDPILVSLCLEEIEKITRIEKKRLQLWEEIIPLKKSKVQNLNKNLQKNSEPLPRGLVRLLIALILQNPQVVSRVKDDFFLKTLELPGVHLLAQLIELTRKNPNLSTHDLLEKYTDHPDLPILATLALWDCLIPEEGIFAEFDGAWWRLYLLFQEKEMELLLAKSRLTGLDFGEKRRLQELLTASKAEETPKKQPLESI